MISVVELPTVIALKDVSTARLGAAVQDVPHGFPMAREHPVPVTLEVLRPVLQDNVGDGVHEEARLSGFLIDRP
jgi:hypothetical protein